MAKFRRVTLFQNPASGTHGVQAREQVRARLNAISESVEEVTIADGINVGERAVAAIKDGADLIVAAGGDGTVREIATALVGKDAQLAIVPLGTFNNLALSLSIPREPAAACDIIEFGKTRKIDVGVANDNHYFFEASGVGVDAELFPIGEEVKSGRFQNLFRAILLALSRNQIRVELRFDRPVGEAYNSSFRGQSKMNRRRRRFRSASKSVSMRCSFIAVANGPYYGSNFHICPGATVDDGLLSISGFRNFSKLELIRHLWSITGGRYQYHPKLERFEAATVEIVSKKPLAAHVDGVPIGSTPVQFKVLPGALKVIVP
ncbi:MAG: diacylglycerol kinase family lipid kinase [Verrucomicrobia bacterium]|nr:diacylglycerol kinase family lipid kinase [Verrucomicrobiota bacterium]MBV9673312.1 diacylglycerol kinase family lipid kinase [Verrucomicrobiota bacterium]